MFVRAALVGFLALLLVGGASAGAAPGSGSSGTVVEYVAPVPEPVVVLRPFAPPATPYGPGHLGADLRATDDAPVRAAGEGTVTFAGQVAGRGVVVLAHADGIRTEYEPVRPAVRAGARVPRGQVIGRLAGRHRGCAVACLHWGARRGDRYVDPLSLLRPLGPVVLLPWPRAG